MVPDERLVVAEQPFLELGHGEHVVLVGADQARPCPDRAGGDDDLVGPERGRTRRGRPFAPARSRRRRARRCAPAIRGSGRAPGRRTPACRSTPPSESLASHSQTWWPRSARTRAVSNPAAPPPATSTRRGDAVGPNAPSCSRPVAAVGDAAQRFVHEDVADAAVLVDARADVVDAPAASLFGRSGSASSLRPIATKSALPSASTRLGLVGLEATEGDHRHVDART